MSDDPGFLSRWSRRKREAKQEIDPPVPRSPSEAAEPSELAAQTGDESPAPDTITEEEIAALPSIEELTRETDITPFLRKGVPHALRNAALRRVWSADPAIRDFVSEAREYAYDWNVPGNVPGTGPLLASDDVPAMLQRMFGSMEKCPTQGADVAETPVITHPTPPLQEAPPNASLVRETEIASWSGSDPPQSPTTSPAPQPEDSNAEQGQARSYGTPRRRHGGALPS